ncbi:TetR family transcriptional regulator [Pantoea sp. Ap-967]|uniref:TetR/AcrR family transcriptional regulator n=1 Tax=Pantoea sp. Ap-967 TaxID=2608362 RepID=UPI00141F530C|nr:TetR family transcriptional regulator [Pantoea sp. Ap-967]NIE75918.1 TetR family transcriptional regulator [Pantoea sp. Ap-967]
MKKRGRPKGAHGTSGKWQDIVDAAVEIILDEGIRKLTYRKLSLRTDVSPGTITYYFDGLDQVIGQAAARYIPYVGGFLDTEILVGSKSEEVGDYLALVASGGNRENSPSKKAVMEFYWFLLGKPCHHGILHEWRNVAIGALNSRYGCVASRFLYAYVEGAAVHGCMTGGYPSFSEAKQNISKLLNGLVKL